MYNNIIIIDLSCRAQARVTETGAPRDDVRADESGWGRALSMPPLKLPSNLTPSTETVAAASSLADKDNCTHPTQEYCEWER